MTSRFTVSVIALLFITSSLLSQEKKEEKTFPFQLTLVYPVGTHIKASPQTTFNFSLNALAGVTGGIKGCEIGGILNFNKNDVNGVQVGGIGSVTQGNYKGVRANGIFGTSHSFRGVQVNGILTGTNESHGLIISGILNLTRSSNVTIAGIANANIETVDGFQLAGIFNITDKIHGVQLGLINVTDSVDRGVSIGLVSITRHDYFRQWSVSFADYMNTGVNFRNGTKDLYNVYSVGVNYIADPLWVAGFGFGHISRIDKNFNFQPELVCYTYFPTDFRHVRDTWALHAKIGFNYEFNDKLSLTFAPSIYGALKSDEGKYETAGYDQSPINPVISHKTNGNSVLEAGFGLSIELCIK